MGKFPKYPRRLFATRTTGSRPVVVSSASLLVPAAAHGNTAGEIPAMLSSRVTMLIAKVCAFSLLLWDLGEQG